MNHTQINSDFFYSTAETVHRKWGIYHLDIILDLVSEVFHDMFGEVYPKTISEEQQKRLISSAHYRLRAMFTLAKQDGRKIYRRILVPEFSFGSLTKDQNDTLQNKISNDNNHFVPWSVQQVSDNVEFLYGVKLTEREAIVLCLSSQHGLSIQEITEHSVTYFGKQYSLSCLRRTFKQIRNKICASVFLTK